MIAKWGVLLRGKGQLLEKSVWGNSSSTQRGAPPSPPALCFDTYLIFLQTIVNFKLLRLYFCFMVIQTNIKLANRFQCSSCFRFQLKLWQAHKYSKFEFPTIRIQRKSISKSNFRNMRMVCLKIETLGFTLILSKLENYRLIVYQGKVCQSLQNSRCYAKLLLYRGYRGLIFDSDLPIQIVHANKFMCKSNKPWLYDLDHYFKKSNLNKIICKTYQPLLP